MASTGFTDVFNQGTKEFGAGSSTTPAVVDATGFKAVGGENTLGLNQDDDTAQEIFDKLDKFVITIPKAFNKVYLVTDANLALMKAKNPSVTKDDLLFEFESSTGVKSYIITPLDSFIDLKAIKSIKYKTTSPGENILLITTIEGVLSEIDLSRFKTKVLTKAEIENKVSTISGKVTGKKVHEVIKKNIVPSADDNNIFLLSPNDGLPFVRSDIVQHSGLGYTGIPQNPNIAVTDNTKKSIGLSPLMRPTTLLLNSSSAWANYALKQGTHIIDLYVKSTQEVMTIAYLADVGTESLARLWDFTTSQLLQSTTAIPIDNGDVTIEAIKIEDLGVIGKHIVLKLYNSSAGKLRLGSYALDTNPRLTLPASYDIGFTITPFQPTIVTDWKPSNRYNAGEKFLVTSPVTDYKYALIANETYIAYYPSSVKSGTALDPTEFARMKFIGKYISTTTVKVDTLTEAQFITLEPHQMLVIGTKLNYNSTYYNHNSTPTPFGASGNDLTMVSQINRDVTSDAIWVPNYSDFQAGDTFIQTDSTGQLYTYLVKSSWGTSDVTGAVWNDTERLRYDVVGKEKDALIEYMIVDKIITAPFPANDTAGIIGLSSSLNGLFKSDGATYSTNPNPLTFRDGMIVFVKTTKDNYQYDRASGLFSKIQKAVSMRIEFKTELLLKATIAVPYQKTLNKANDREYIFKLTGDLSASEIADVENLSDDASTGKWIYQKPVDTKPLRDLIVDFGSPLATQQPLYFTVPLLGGETWANVKLKYEYLEVFWYSNDNWGYRLNSMIIDNEIIGNLSITHVLDGQYYNATDFNVSFKMTATGLKAEGANNKVRGCKVYGVKKQQITISPKNLIPQVVPKDETIALDAVMGVKKTITFASNPKELKFYSNNEGRSLSEVSVSYNDLKTSGSMKLQTLVKNGGTTASADVTELAVCQFTVTYISDTSVEVEVTLSGYVEGANWATRANAIYGLKKVVASYSTGYTVSQVDPNQIEVAPITGVRMTKRFELNNRISRQTGYHKNVIPLTLTGAVAFRAYYNGNGNRQVVDEIIVNTLLPEKGLTGIYDTWYMSSYIINKTANSFEYWVATAGDGGTSTLLLIEIDYPVSLHTAITPA